MLQHQYISIESLPNAVESLVDITGKHGSTSELQTVVEWAWHAGKARTMGEFGGSLINLRSRLAGEHSPLDLSEDETPALFNILFNIYL